MTIRKYLVLDIDGVLNSTSYWHERGQDLPLGKSGALDPAAIERLNEIVERTGCTVILSSSWRGKGNSAPVETMLRERGYRHRLHGSTCLLVDDPRHKEIERFFDDEFRGVVPPMKFVVLDDDPDAWSEAGKYAPWGRFVNTNYLVGLQRNGVDAAVEWLEES